jgi:hypothetical protein
MPAFYPILCRRCGVLPGVTVRILAATALILGILAAPAAAAVTLDPLKPCYVSAGAGDDRREGVDLHGAGFTAGAVVDIFIDGVPALGDVPVDSVGEVSARVLAPFQREGDRDFTITVAERNNPVNVVTVTSRVTALRVTLSPREARPTAKVRYRGSGFTADAPVFAHYLYGGAVRKTVRLVRRPEACGAFEVRRRQIPVRPRVGNWTVQIDQQQTYTATPSSNWVRMRIKVRRIFIPPA